MSSSTPSCKPLGAGVGGAVHRPFPVGVRLPLPRPPPGVHLDHRAAALLHGPEPAPDRRQRLPQPRLPPPAGQPGQEPPPSPLSAQLPVAESSKQGARQDRFGRSGLANLWARPVVVLIRTPWSSSWLLSTRSDRQLRCALLGVDAATRRGRHRRVQWGTRRAGWWSGRRDSGDAAAPSCSSRRPETTDRTASCSGRDLIPRSGHVGALGGVGRA